MMITDFIVPMIYFFINSYVHYIHNVSITNNYRSQIYISVNLKLKQATSAVQARKTPAVA